MKTPQQTAYNPQAPPTVTKARSQRRLLVESNDEDAQFSFHEENPASGNLGPETMEGDISKQSSIFDAPGDPILKLSPGIKKVGAILTLENLYVFGKLYL